jgi:uncharacterized protein (TIGR02246 family)
MAEAGAHRDQSLARMVDGWNRRDADARAAAFADDAELIISGQHIRKRSVVREGYQHLFETMYQHSRLQAELGGVRLPRPHVAVTRVHGHLEYRPTSDVTRDAGFPVDAGVDQ